MKIILGYLAILIFLMLGAFLVVWGIYFLESIIGKF